MTRIGIALAIASCFSGAAFAAAATAPPTVNVNVTNPVLPVEVRNANPIPVAVSPSEEPFQTSTVAVTFANSVASATLVTVPAGKTLVIEHVSAWISVSPAGGLESARLFIQGLLNQSDALVCQATGSNDQSHFFSCAGPTKFYVYEGQTLRFAANTAEPGGGAFQVLVSGHYTPAP